MANPIKYNTSAETLALKKGNFYIGTGDVGKGPTSSTGYYNGITPPSGGFTMIGSDKPHPEESKIEREKKSRSSRRIDDSSDNFPITPPAFEGYRAATEERLLALMARASKDIGLTTYSYRSASKISIREALHAGNTPNTTPTTKATANAGSVIQSGARISKEGNPK